MGILQRVFGWLGKAGRSATAPSGTPPAARKVANSRSVAASSSTPAKAQADPLGQAVGLMRASRWQAALDDLERLPRSDDYVLLNSAVCRWHLGRPAEATRDLAVLLDERRITPPAVFSAEILATLCFAAVGDRATAQRHALALARRDLTGIDLPTIPTVVTRQSALESLETDAIRAALATLAAGAAAPDGAALATLIASYEARDRLVGT